MHIGHIIENEFHRQGRRVQWFAEQLCCDRTNVYAIFKRETIDTGLLLRISQLLNHDFFTYYSQDLHTDSVPHSNAVQNTSPSP
ncbi:MAG: XRE family transcriptional regulator [Paludibacteraceae bacterium]|nr:XRE family transcriptional regulator [Paludibacteraceae bacterium]